MQNHISTVGSSTLPREQPLQLSRFIADGGSASGHVAACAGVIEGNESNDDNAEIRSIPNALVLFNPVIDTKDKGYGSEKFTPETQTELRPCHHVRKGLPPTYIVHGTDDKTVPFEHIECFNHLRRKSRQRLQAARVQTPRARFLQCSRFQERDEGRFHRHHERRYCFSRLAGSCPQRRPRRMKARAGSIHELSQQLIDHVCSATPVNR